MNTHDPNCAASTSSHMNCLDMAQAVSMFGGDESLRKIMAMAVQRLDEEVAAIAASLQAGDTAAAGRMLHGIKGFAPLFCSEHMAGHIAEVEGLSKSGSASQVGAAYDVLAPSLVRLRDEMKAYLLTTI